MLMKIDSGNLGENLNEWLSSKFHFAFSDYCDPMNISFGVLRVINDDVLSPGRGFDSHPHSDMEIISYVVDGELTHEDNIGNKTTLVKGQFQCMSAGEGIWHSEFNYGNGLLRFIQIWIFPSQKCIQPKYSHERGSWNKRKGRWYHGVSSDNGNGVLKINQDADIYVTEIETGMEIVFDVAETRQAYLVQLEGKSLINDIEMFSQDGMKIIEEMITIKSLEKSHILLVDMAK